MKNKTEEKESRCDLSVVSVFIRKLSTFEGRELNCNSIVDIQQEISVKYT